MSTLVEAILWGRRVGVVEMPDDADVARFQFDSDFATSDIEVAPLQMPLDAGRVYSFPANAGEGFHGLPGTLADSLPDRFGNALIDSWLAEKGRRPGSMNAVERLSYVGTRGMGALEFKPTTGPDPKPSHEVDVEELRLLAGELLSQREDVAVSFRTKERREALDEILRVGSSAGGARPKALIAFNPGTEDVRSGQVDAGSGFEHWILKFDGVEDNSSQELGNAQGYGAVEFTYSQMARAAGIEMSKTRLLGEGDRRHFMTKRFDRTEKGAKLHMQSLAALAHLDYNLVRAHSYEQAFHVLRQLRLDSSAREQLFRRMLFNIVARNQDDHVKNIAFLMDRRGRWRLAPAYDMTYAYNPDRGSNTSQHQMSIGGMRDGFTVEDIVEVGEIVPLPRGRAQQLLAEVTKAVAQWPRIAGENSVAPARIEGYGSTHRLSLPATHSV